MNGENIMITQNDLKWHQRFMRIADEVATWSKDPSSQLGSVAVLNRKILATGYNGFPKNINDNDETRFSDRETKYKYTIHSELNLCLNAAENCVSLKGSTVYISGKQPICSECCKMMIQVGVETIVMPRITSTDPKWLESWKFSQSMIEEVNQSRKMVYIFI